MQTQKATKKSVSLSPEALEAAEKKARRETGGNLSRYLQSLILRDVEQTPRLPSGREKILEELAEQWVPTLAESLTRLLREKGVNQAELFGRCLEKLRDYLAGSAEDGAVDFLLIPEWKCPIFAEKQRRLGLMSVQAGGKKLAQEMRALREELGRWVLEK